MECQACKEIKELKKATYELSMWNGRGVDYAVGVVITSLINLWEAQHTCERKDND